jgi:hypothetical protein
MSRAGIEQYLYMMEQAFDASEGWHSLMKNLGDVREDEWDWVPGASRARSFAGAQDDSDRHSGSDSPHELTLSF